MKILLHWPNSGDEMRTLFSELKKTGHEVAYWIGEYDEGKKNCPPGTIYHDHYKAWGGEPAEVFKDIRIEPPDAELITSMISAESIILPMMNKRYDTASVDERKQIYFDTLAYWNFVLEKVAPDAVILSGIPHSIYAYILYELAKKKGIPVWCCEQTWVANTVMWYSDFWHGSDELRENIQRLKAGKLTPADLGDEMRTYWEEHTGEKSRTQPVYMTAYFRSGKGWGIVKRRFGIAMKTLMNGSLFALAWRYLGRKIRMNLRKEYAKVARKPDWNKPFVYFPLHFQPEGTTSPQGGVYHQQILVAETLAAALPAGWELYVKEHPVMWMLRTMESYSSVRYRGYYERLAQIPGVRLVLSETNTFELTEKAKAVAVITGTSGWEALLMGKAPLVFGIPWYRDCPGVIHVDSVATCKTAFQNIEKGFGTTEHDVLAFLKALEESSTRAYLAKDPLEKNPRYSPEENMATIARHIATMISK